ncbi:MAG TPA: YjdF family protein [Prolixibacteraceae bacterium]|nr:YjdF family protein [Prolixibacteraceae bacterium]HPS12763.1 YjdF family protein [Prolixibacteraceae bacterium]
MCDTTEITVLYEDPFWVALIEKSGNGSYVVARVVIGTSEPTGATLTEFFDQLDVETLRFSKPVEEESAFRRKELGFKKQLHKNNEYRSSEYRHTYTKAQAMLKQQQSELKTERKEVYRQEKEESLQRKFDLRQQKRKEKHRGH